MELVEGRDAGGAAARRRPRPAGCRGARHRPPDRRRARRGARTRRRPPRPEAGQHQDHAGRRREGARLRARQRRDPTKPAGADLSHSPTITSGGTARRRDSRHRGLHESRAGARQAGRQAHRHLGVRLRAVRNAHRPARVRRRDRVGHDRRDPEREPDWSALPPATSPTHVARAAAALSREGSRAGGCATSATRVSSSTRRRSPRRRRSRHARRVRRANLPWASRLPLSLLAAAAIAWRAGNAAPNRRRAAPHLSQAVRITNTPDAEFGPAISPDGKWVAYYANATAALI